MIAAVFGENMVDDGYQDVVNIDISSVVIEQMKKKYHDKPQLKCIIFCLQPSVLECLCSMSHMIWYHLFFSLYWHRHEDGCKGHVIFWVRFIRRCYWQRFIVIVVLDSIMEEIVNICICIGNMALCSNPICYCRNTRFYYGESSFCQDTWYSPSLILNNVSCISVWPKFTRECNENAREGQQVSSTLFICDTYFLNWL